MRSPASIAARVLSLKTPAGDGGKQRIEENKKRNNAEELTKVEVNKTNRYAGQELTNVDQQQNGRHDNSELQLPPSPAFRMR
jgi:hypothetical protein